MNYGPGLDIGYRWFQANQVAPLFAFGYGLSYTTFKLSSASLKSATGGVVVRVNVTNTGSRAGSDAVQAYVQYPSGAGEPPHQLRAFARVALAAHQTRTITLTIARDGFQVFMNNHFVTLAGTYGVDLGSSSSDLPIHLSTQFT